MPPFGLIKVVMTLGEAAADAVNPRRSKETPSERRRFLFFYVILMLAGIAVVL
jgi:hypothetical protein